MGRPFIRIWLKLIFVALLSTLCLTAPARAHEVTPTIADLSTADSQITLSLRLNAESFLAGLDLDDLTDTDEADTSGIYDVLRALTPDEMTARLTTFLADWPGSDMLRVGQTTIPLTIAAITVPAVGDVELPRATDLTLTGTRPTGATSLALNWPDGFGALVLRQQGVDDPYTGYIQGGGTSGPITLRGGGAVGSWQTFVDYIPVGFDHILPKGLDHILFVLGLFFLSTKLRPLLWQVTAFTLAHTVTLALGALGWVTVPGSIVEPLIAASIVYVAIENVLTSGLSRWRPLVIFGFGLLHGLGFASVLGEFGLPQAQFFPALIGFNIGVELGQLTVIAAAFLAVGLLFRKQRWYRGLIAMPASVMIAAVGAYWFVERVFL